MGDPEQATATVSPGEETEVTLSAGDPAFCLSAGNILFPTASSFIASTPAHIQAFRAVLDRLAASPAERLLVVGHTDDVGSASSNQTLSERRARTTLAVLTGDVVEWEAIYRTERGSASSARWGDADFTAMLTATGNPATPQSVQEHRELTPAGEARRATLFRSFFQVLRDGLPAPATLNSLAPPRLGCGEDHVLGSGDHPPSRRSEFFLVLGTPATTIECRFYPNWRTACGAIPVIPQITVARNILVVKKPHTQPARVQVDLGTNLPFPRNGTFTRSRDAVRFFDAAVGGNEIVFTGNSVDFTGAQLTAGVRLFAEARGASVNMNDIHLTLTLAPGVAPRAAPPATADVTAVALTLDIFQSRTAIGVDPAPLPQVPAAPPAAGTTPTDKWFGGRFLHVQVGGHHGRALMIVRRVQPPAFNGILVLRQVSIAGNSVSGLDVRVQAFDNERPTPGEIAKANPHEFAAPPADVRLFVEGAGVSGGLRDTGFQLGIKDVEDDGDRVAVTVVRFTNLQADVPSTPANATRMGNSPVPRHTVQRATTAAISAADFDEAFDETLGSANAPLVLVEDSIQAADPIGLSVQVAPAGVPVSWSIQRDTRAAPDGDHADIVALSPNATPTLTPDPANDLQATLVSDAVGSFFIRPFVDANGNGSFDHNIDREPFILMHLVLIRVQGFQNNSVQQSHNVTVTPAVPTAATGVQFSTGAFTNAGVAGVHNDASVTVIGGGGDGRRGLSRLFAGWVNDVAGQDSFAEYFDAATGNTHRHVTVFVSNNPSPPPAVVGFFIPVGSVAPPGAVTSAVAPAVLPEPILDTSNFGPPEGVGGNTCVGNEGAVGPPLPIVKTPLPTATNPVQVGEEWRVQEWDSPGFAAGPNHIVQPGNLARFRHNVEFRIDLCFWTNIDGVPGATAAPGGAACRLYSSVQTNTWNIRFEITFNAAGVAAIVQPGQVQIAQDPHPNRLAIPVTGTGHETRFPIVLRVVAIDAR